jgi:hypothetical protein
MLKLHPALNDPLMKFPRTANVLLDVGMLLAIIGCVWELAAVAIEPWSPSLLPFIPLVVGIALLGASRAVAKLRRADPCVSGTGLRRVK